ncbi:MAG: hypothetical protein AAGA27_08415 [Pseudomonadota bacterium]
MTKSKAGCCSTQIKPKLGRKTISVRSHKRSTPKKLPNSCKK